MRTLITTNSIGFVLATLAALPLSAVNIVSKAHASKKNMMLLMPLTTSSNPVMELVDACNAGKQNTLALIASMESHEVDQMYNDTTPLMAAVTMGNIAAIQALLKKGANPNIFNKRGRSALICALDAVSKNEDCGKKMIDILISHQAEVSPAQRRAISAIKHGQKVLASCACKKEVMTKLYLADAIAHARQGAYAKLKQDLMHLSKEDINTFLPITSSVGNLNPLLAAVITDGASITPRMIKNKVETASLLLGKGAECNARNNKGICPLDIVIKHESLTYSSPMLKMMLTKISPDHKDAHGKTILTRVIENAPFNNLEGLIQVMVEKKSDINLCDNKGNSPLMTLLYRSNKKAMRAEDWNNQVASLCKSIDILKKNNVDRTYECQGKTALALARTLMPANSENEAIFQALDPKTPAIQHTVSSFVQAIMQKQDIDDQSWQTLKTVNEIDPKTNMTPLMAAVQKRNLDLVQKLIAMKADPNMHNNKGATPLSIIIENMSCGSASISPKEALALVQPLMQAGANPNQPILRGKSTIDYARSRLKNSETRQALLKEFAKKPANIKTAHN